MKQRNKKNILYLAILFSNLIFLVYFIGAQNMFKATRNCSDSDITFSYPDGKNPFMRGTVIYENISLTDYCLNFSVVEYYCDFNLSTFRSYVYACGKGYVCENGSCVKEEGQKASCVDTDGGVNYYEEGFVIINNATYYRDKCLNTTEGTLMEYFCENETPKHVFYDCPGICIEGACKNQTQKFRRGNVNNDDKIDITDGIFLLDYLFSKNTTKLTCQDAADINDDGKVDISDAVYLFQYLSYFRPAPPNPFSEIGVDPTPDDLGCLCYSEVKSC